jgi:hypothetical protein
MRTLSWWSCVVILLIAAVAPAAPIGRYRLTNAGVWADFEQLGGNKMLLPGDIIQHLDEIDPPSGMRIYDEVALQMDAMRAIGINTITHVVGTAGTSYDHPEFPNCNQGPGFGLQFPSPTALELTNLGRFLDLAASKGIKVILRLTNSQEDDLTGSATWLDAIFGVVRAHPAAVDLISFDGDLHTIDTDGDGKPDQCGGVSEPRLFLGFQSQQAQFIRWAIQRGMTAGLPPRILSAEAAIGAKVFFDQSPTTMPGAQDGHFWDTVGVEKQIFDSLGIPDAQRTYGLSFYEMSKCGVLVGCVDEPRAAWTEELADRVTQIVGAKSGARVLAVEMGNLSPVDPAWPTTRALEHLTDVMEAHGFAGGAYWLWAAPSLDWQTDPKNEQDVKLLGSTFQYTPVVRNMQDIGGFHLIAIPNGSFENGSGVPDDWFLVSSRHRAAAATPSSGKSVGSMSRIDLGQPEVPTRGTHALRLTTGDASDSSIAAWSEPIPVTPGTTYTTAMALRFGWSGDPNSAARPESRPNVSIAFDYFDAAGRPVAAHPSDVFRYFQEDATTGFGTFVLRYTPPDGAQTVRIEIGAHRNGLPQPITVDADAVR